MRKESAEELVEKGRHLLDQRDYEGAGKLFAQALAMEDAPPIRNNLAMARYLGGKPEKALEIVSPNIREGAPYNPFAHALAAQALAALGQKEEARKQIKGAVQDFEKGAAEMRRATGAVADFWREYTVMVQRAAATLGNDRLVLDIFRRWQRYHISWENKYMAAVASFNLGRFRQAASYWVSIANTVDFASEMQQVTLLVERGIIPPFTMDYDYPSMDFQMATWYLPVSGC